jgi:hypothetical protein
VADFIEGKTQDLQAGWDTVLATDRFVAEGEVRPLHTFLLVYSSQA